jgi:hypothetical protein
MANFSKTSRLNKGIKGTYRNNTVVYPRFVDYTTLQSVGSIVLGPDIVYRPDLISLRAYNRSDLGWFIMGFNNIDHIRDLSVGETLNIPDTRGIF